MIVFEHLAKRAGSPTDSHEGLAYTLFIFVAVVTNSEKEQNIIHEFWDNCTFKSTKGRETKSKKKESVSKTKIRVCK